MRIGAAQRKPFRNEDEHYWRPATLQAPRIEWVRCFHNRLLPMGQNRFGPRRRLIVVA